MNYKIVSTITDLIISVGWCVLCVAMVQRGESISALLAVLGLCLFAGFALTAHGWVREATEYQMFREEMKNYLPPYLPTAVFQKIKRNQRGTR